MTGCTAYDYEAWRTALDEARGWEALGEAGIHESHRLRGETATDVFCLDCGRMLTDDEADEAWPVDEE